MRGPAPATAPVTSSRCTAWRGGHGHGLQLPPSPVQVHIKFRPGRIHMLAVDGETSRPLFSRVHASVAAYDDPRDRWARPRCRRAPREGRARAARERSRDRASLRSISRCARNRGRDRALDRIAHVAAHRGHRRRRVPDPHAVVRVASGLPRPRAARHRCARRVAPRRARAGRVVRRHRRRLERAARRPPRRPHHARRRQADPRPELARARHRRARRGRRPRQRQGRRRHRARCRARVHVVDRRHQRRRCDRRRRRSAARRATCC